MSKIGEVMRSAWSSLQETKADPIAAARQRNRNEAIDACATQLIEIFVKEEDLRDRDELKTEASVALSGLWNFAQEEAHKPQFRNF